MRKVILIAALAAGTAVLLPAQGRGRGGAMGASPGSMHSNAPANSPAASADRDFGRQRAEDVGQGKKKGLNKPHVKKTRKNKHGRSNG